MILGVRNGIYCLYQEPHTSCIDDQSGINYSPYEKLTGKMPSVKHIRVCGCASFVYIKSPKSKAHTIAQPGIFISCDDNGVYKIELLGSRKCMNNVHVTFDEMSFPLLENSGSSSLGEDENWTRGVSENDSESKSDHNLEQHSEQKSENSSEHYSNSNDYHENQENTHSALNNSDSKSSNNDLFTD